MSQRKQPRINCDMILNKYEHGAMNIVRATNISLGGMRFHRLLEPYANRGEKFRLELALPGEPDPLLIGAKRVYEDEDFVGVRFTNISHRHFVRLRSWIREMGIVEELPPFPEAA